MNKNWIKISQKDNVIVALKTLKAGLEIEGLVLKSDVPAGHKIALKSISAGDQVIKYGYPIGCASVDINPGDHVHTANLKTILTENEDYSYNPVSSPEPFLGLGDKTFMGYPRGDGRVGTRNEIWIINTVGCVNGTAARLAEKADDKFKGKTDGIFTFVHPYGCSQLGEDHEATKNILLNLAKHPNAGGVLILGLGCENNSVKEFKESMGDFDSDRVKFMVTQEVEDEIEEGMKLLEQLVSSIENDSRVPVPLSKLVVGMKCGGSDGLSGITANPLVGRFTDFLVNAGGTSILTEVPEMFGAERILMNRCCNEKVFQKTVEMINEFKNYFLSHGQTVYENPSPGNKEGGITTLEEKSLGCIQKGGHSIVSDVISYGCEVTENGLILLNGPGNDIVSTTALTAAGANLILFTTGRGTPLGAPVPTVKISSNSTLAKRKKNWIDFNAGVLVEGDDTETVSEAFLKKIIDFASGMQTKNEINGYREIAIFKDGVTL